MAEAVAANMMGDVAADAVEHVAEDVVEDVAADFMANLSYPVLALIFDLLPIRDVISCAGVCRLWREHLSSSPRWRSFQLGQNINHHADKPAIDHFLFLPKLTEVKLTQIVPLILRRAFSGLEYSEYSEILERRFGSIPVELARAILSHGSDLRKLDLSSMRLPELDQRSAFWEIWTDENIIVESQLTDLALPREFDFTSDLLKAIFNKHPSLERLTFAGGPEGFPGGPPNGQSLKHLGLDVLDHLTSYSSEDVCRLLVDTLAGYQLESLTIKESNYDQSWSTLTYVRLRLGCGIASAITQPELQLKGQLVHLHLGAVISCKDLEQILSEFCCLETLRIDRIVEDGDLANRRPFVVASQRLQSVSCSLDTWGLGNAQQGILRLVKTMTTCKRLRDLQILPPRGRISTDVANISDSIISKSKLLEESDWSKISTIYFYATTEQDFIEFAQIFPRMSGLSTLYLYHYSSDSSDSSDSDFLAKISNAGSPYLQSLQIVAPSPRLLDMFKFWNDVSKLAVWIPRPFRLCLGEFAEKVPLTWRLEELTFSFCFLRLKLDGDVSPALSNALQFLRKLTILPVADFEPGSFKTLVALCPLIESFKLDHDHENDPLFARIHTTHNRILTLEDLWALSGWKRLRECLLFVDVDFEDVAEDPLQLYQDFASKCMSLKQADFIPRLINEWKASLRHLECVEVIAKILNSNIPVWRPLLFASSCGLGLLHFVHARPCAARAVSA